MGKLLTREQILKAQLRSKVIDLPEWGGPVRIQELTSAQLMGLKFGALQGPNGKLDNEKLKRLHAQMVVDNVIDEDRNRLFNVDDMPALLALSGDVLKRIADEVAALSGMSDEGDALKNWLEEKHPDILKEFEDSQNPVEKAKEDFMPARNGALPTV